MTIQGTRTPTAYAFDQALESMQTRRSALMQLQGQLASGQRVNKPSDDPSAAAQEVRLRSQTARLEAEKRMIDYAKTALQTADGALGSAVEEVQTARELLLQAANGTHSPSDRASIAQQIRGVRDNLLAIANRPDGAGGYVFGGAGTQSAPFVAGAAVSYAPQTGQVQIASDPALSATQDGAGAFLNLSTPSGSTTLFKALDDAIAVLENGAATGAQISAATKAGIDGLDAGLDRLNLVRTKIGEDLRLVDTHSRRIDSDGVNLKGRLSDLIDLDYAKAITDLNTNQTALEAAMKTYSQVSRMSLFQYL